MSDQFWVTLDRADLASVLLRIAGGHGRGEALAAAIDDMALVAEAIAMTMGERAALHAVRMVERIVRAGDWRAFEAAVAGGAKTSSKAC